MKVEKMPNVPLSPEVLIAQVQEESRHIENVVIVYQYKGQDRTLTSWSKMDTRDLAYYATVLMAAIMDRTRQSGGDES